MHEIKHVLELLATWIDYVGVLVVLYGFTFSLLGFVRDEFAHLSGRADLDMHHALRMKLGSYILLAIEFMIASDIIHTVLSRELDDLIFVSALVVIRTAISYFLGLELKELRQEHKAESLPTP